MSTDTARSTFAILCVLGIIALGTGALLEVARKRRGDSLLGARHFNLRMMSALIWLIVLASLFYAVTMLWPQPNDKEQAQRFLSVISGAFLLLAIALGLLVYDVWAVVRAGQQSESRFNQQLATLV